MTRLAWYGVVAALWALAIGVGAGLNWGIHQLPVPDFVRVALDVAVWSAVGASLYGRWGYRTHLEEEEIRRQLRARWNR